MARDYIKIDTTTTTAIHARTLQRYVNSLRDAYEQGKLVLAIMNHNNDGSVWTDIEALFGLPSGKGQTVYDLMNGSVGAMEGAFQTADAKNLTETVG
jgi:hypothetical protein